MTTIVGSAQRNEGSDTVHDLRCFCTAVVAAGELSVGAAKSALAFHLREPEAHGPKFSNADAADLMFEPVNELGRTNIQFVGT